MKNCKFEIISVFAVRYTNINKNKKKIAKSACFVYKKKS